MLRPLNRFSTAIYALLVTACFNPDAPGSDTDDGTSGSSDSSATGSGDSVGSSGLTGSTTGTEATSAQTGTDSSGGVDLPPEVTSFTVNGSNAPAEIATSGLAVLDADAMDDVGIDRVEFYDGDKLVATATASPYRAEVLLTSADNGSHSVWARAVDTSEQEGVSEPVEFNMNVIGGEMLELREDIATATVILNSAPQLSAEGSRVRLAALEDGLALHYRAFDLELSLLEHVPPSGSNEFEFNSAAPPRLTPSGSHTLIGGAIGDSENQYNTAVFRIDHATAEFETFSFGTTEGAKATAMDISSDGTVVFFRSSGVVAKYTPDLSTEVWSTEIGDDSSSPMALVIAEDDDIVIKYRGPECGTSSNSCLRKIRPDGEIEWTRTTPSESVALAISGDGQIAVPRYDEDNSGSIDLFSPNGDPLPAVELGVGRAPVAPHYDPQGNILVVGTLVDLDSENRTAWAARLTPDGTQIWERIYDFAPWSFATSVATTTDGRAYMTGVGEIIEFELFSFTAPAFIAEVAL